MVYLSLNNEELHQKTMTAAAAEKSATLALLEILQEVERRKLFAERGHSSLWMYVHRELGYSEAQTSERVAAMRLMTRVPEVRVSLKESKLTLTTVAKLASFVKKEKTPAERTIALLQRIQDQSKREVEKILLSEQANPHAKPDFIRSVSAGTVRVSFDADEEFMQILDLVKSFQVNPGLSMQELIKKTMKEYVTKREVKLVAKVGQMNKVQRSASRPDEVVTNEQSPVKAASPGLSRYISAEVKRRVSHRSGQQCEFIARIKNPLTGQFIQKRCESKSQLQFDHQFPHALGGTSLFENIRHLCSTHNLLQAKRFFGEDKLKKSG